MNRDGRSLRDGDGDVEEANADGGGADGVDGEEEAVALGALVDLRSDDGTESKGSGAGEGEESNEAEEGPTSRGHE